MSDSSTHPDQETLQSWLDFRLSEDEASRVERHVSDCDDCARLIDQITSDPEQKLAGHVRAMYHGQTDGEGDDPGQTRFAPVPGDLDQQQSSSSSRGEDLPNDETVRSVTLVWQRACENASYAHETVKGQAAFAESCLLDLPIKTRSVSDGSPSDVKIANSESDDYHLLNVIGRGGMGVVYNARQSSVDRVVAIKMLQSNKQNDDSRRKMFLQEAVVTADLDHPNIIPIHELGSNDEGSLFYSMKKVDGACWGDQLSSNSCEDNIALLMRVCDAVAFAHSRGIVHRDLKPDNVMLGEFGEVWLMDWGLAQPTRDYRKAELAEEQQMGGTPAYMAPEMTDPKKRVGPLSDVYLLGAILFHIVTGKPPHRGKSVLQCLLAAARNVIEPPEVENDLLKIAYKAMESLPKDRYQSVSEFQDALQKWMSHSESLAIAENAESLLKQAQIDGSDQDFVRAVFGFEQAHMLFPDNPDFVTRLQRANHAYASCACRRGDFDLALSLLDPSLPDHAKLKAEVEDRKREQQTRLARARQQQIAFRVVLGATAVLMMLGIGIAFWLRASALQLANTNEPAMHASLSLQSGLRRSLGVLTGWVALGHEPLKEARAEAWEKEIRPALARLRWLARSEGSDQTKQYEELNQTFEELHDIQWWIEEVAQTPGNEPAKELYFSDIWPIEESINEALASLVQLERRRAESTPDSEFRGGWTDLQVLFARANRDLGDFIDKGMESSERSFRIDRRQAASILDGFQSDNDLGPLQRSLVDWTAKEMGAYRQLAERAIELRQSDQANVAIWRFREQALPRADKAENTLREIVESHRAMTLENSRQINFISVLAIAVAASVAIVAIFAVWMSLVRERVVRRGNVSGHLAVPVAMLFFTLASASPGQRCSAQTPSVEPADVHVKVGVILADLESLRLEMGKPKSGAGPFSVRNAAPHEVYFQALTLFDKTDQLCFEQMRQRKSKPQSPSGPIGPADVLEVVSAVSANLDDLKRHLGVTDVAKRPARNSSHTPNDVFVAILRANRQLNLLTERRFTPSETHQQVTLAVAYAADLLSTFPGATRLPEQPAMERQKTPNDVFGRLTECYRSVREIAEASNVSMLRLELSANADVAPSDVYDIASVLVSELSHLHAVHGGLPSAKRVFSPGPLFPSHVYRRAGMLRKQLDSLAKLVNENPDWLRAMASDNAE